MKEARKWLRMRIVVVMILFLVIFLALLTRAFQLQILSGEVLKELASRQHVSTLKTQPERGMITDRHGEKLAVSLLMDSLCADPLRIPDRLGTAKQIASVVNVDASVVAKKLSAAKNFCWIARRISPDEAAKIEALNLEGVFLVKEPKRFYPNGELAAHVLGVVGVDPVGLEGLELQYDKYIRGKSVTLVWARDAKGKRLYPRVDKGLNREEQGLNLVTTIDSRIQYMVETKLKEVVREKGAKGGYIIVMDPKTGEILALANEPSFDPNNIATKDLPFIKNRAVSDCYDPGSTFKPFLVSAAIEERVVGEKDRVFCENGHYVVADRVIREAQGKRYGYLSVEEVLKYSSNIGSAKIAERLGKERFYNYIKKFGFGSRTMIDLPGEVAGILRPYKQWTKVDLDTIAFGQGISITGIQLITALCSIANGGTLMRPFIVREIVDNEGNVRVENHPEVVRRVITAKTAKRMAQMLMGVVSAEDGTGKKARIENVSVAGKTGTAQKFDFSRHIYSSERVRTAFMGFSPVEDPRVAMLVVLDEPKRDKWGGMASAPVFKTIGEQLLTCFKMGIHPEAFARVEGKGIIEPVAATVPVYTSGTFTHELEEVNDNEVPDFRGMTMREALMVGKSRNINIKVMGTGWAIRQEPEPGATLSAARTCTVYFHTGS